MKAPFSSTSQRLAPFSSFALLALGLLAVVPRVAAQTVVDVAGTTVTTVATGQTDTDYPGGLTKTGTGTLVFGTGAANTYTGPALVSAGTLQFKRKVNLYNNTPASWTAANLTVAAGATAAFNFDGPGEFLAADIATLSALGTATGGFTNGSFIGLDTTSSTNQAGATYSGVIANPNGGANALGLVKLGPRILRLTGANTYSGGTIVQGGTLSFTSLGSGSVTVDGGILQWQAGVTTDLSAQGLSFGSSGATLDTGGNDVTLASAISGAGAFTKTGGGTLTLSAANTYAGGTAVNIGVVAFTSGASLGAGNITLNGGALRWAGGNTTDISSRLNPLGGNGGVFDTNGNNVTFASGLSGTGGLIKVGAGTLTLSGANSYTGLTLVGAGTLLVNGSLDVGSTITVTTGATLGGTGTINGNVQLRSGATLASSLTVIGTVTNLSDTLLFVPNENSNNVSISAVNANGSVTPIVNLPTLLFPWQAAVRGDQAFVYLSENGSNSLSVIDTKTLSIVQTVSNLAIQDSGTVPRPYGVAVSSDGTKIYLSSRTTLTNTVKVFSANILTGRLTFVTSIDVGFGPRGLALNPAGTRLYVVNQSANTVQVIDTGTNTVVATVPVGNQPLDIAVNPGGTRAYVTNFTGNNVSVIDTATNTVVATVPTGNGPHGVAVSPDGNHFYVAIQTDQTVAQFDAATNTAIATPISAGQTTTGLAISADGAFLYATNSSNSDSVAAYTITAGTGVLVANGSFSVGDNPNLPGLGRNGNALLASGATFVANFGGALNSAGTSATFTGGTLLVNNPGLAFSTPISVGPAGGTINTNGYSASVTSVISGSGALTKTGIGTLTLAGANTYTGALTVSTGTLTVNGSVAAGATITVASGATLNGTGTINGNVVLQAGATLGGSLTFNGTLTQTAPVVTSAATASAFVGGAFSYTITATNTPTNYSLAAGVLPAGLTLNAGTGVISGASVTSGTFNVTVAATNVLGTGTKALAITISPLTAVTVSVPASTWTYDGTPKVAPVSTSPGVGAVTVTYYQNGVMTPPVVAGTYQVQAAVAVPGYTGAGFGTLMIAPAITAPPVKASAALGGSATFTVTAASGGALTYQWKKNGADIAGATAATLTLGNVQLGDSGLYSVVVTGGGVSTTSTAVPLEPTFAGKIAGSAMEVGADIRHPNGNTYDQVLLTGASASVKADPGQVVRVSYVDLSDDIVQVEFFGAGTLTLTLENATGPAAPVKYNQPGVAYMKGHATVTITGADATSHLGIFSVGRITALNQSLFQEGVSYDGWADLALVAIASADGKFALVGSGNANYFNTKGRTGIYAPGVQFDKVYVADIDAAGAASAAFVTGATRDAEIAGGDLFQDNGGTVEVAGMTQLTFTAGTSSQGGVVPAQANRARLMRDGVDVTSQLVH